MTVSLPAYCRVCCLHPCNLRSVQPYRQIYRYMARSFKFLDGKRVFCFDEYNDGMIGRKYLADNFESTNTLFCGYRFLIMERFCSLLTSGLSSFLVSSYCKAAEPYLISIIKCGISKVCRLFRLFGLLSSNNIPFHPHAHFPILLLQLNSLRRKIFFFYCVECFLKSLKYFL